ncbi:hypothetical protein OROHE_015555 [Orobanche hederae]
MMMIFYTRETTRHFYVYKPPGTSTGTDHYPFDRILVNYLCPLSWMIICFSSVVIMVPSYRFSTLMVAEYFAIDLIHF